MNSAGTLGKNIENLITINSGTTTVEFPYNTPSQNDLYLKISDQTIPVELKKITAPDSNNSNSGHLFFIRDITKQLEREHLIKKQKEMAEFLITSLFKYIEVGVLILDKDSNVILSNDYVHQLFKGSSQANIISFLNNHNSFILNKRFQLFLKEYQTFIEVYSANVTYPDQNFHKIVFITDITSQKKIEHELTLSKNIAEDSSKVKSEFLATISHELRTPLNAILGFSQILKKQLFGTLNDQQDDYVNEIHTNGKHLLSLLNDVLDLSRIEFGNLVLTTEIFDFIEIINECIQVVKSDFKKNSISLEGSHIVTSINSHLKLINDALNNVF